MDGLFEYDGKIRTSELADIFQSYSNGLFILHEN